MPNEGRDQVTAPLRPAYGLVCMTQGPELRFRTITLKRYRMLEVAERYAALRDLYASNTAKLRSAAGYCTAHGIQLFRMSAALYPMLDLLDDPTGKAVLDELAPELLAVGQAFGDAGIRVLIHPDQYIVLNSERPEVRQSSLHQFLTHADVLDRLGFERSPYHCMILHGGKGGRGEVLAEVIRDLPDAARLRLVLENDERAYSPAELLPVCQATGIPLVFDAHHHVVHDKLESQEDPSVREWVLLTRATWAPPAWQVVHLSNGIEGPQDRRHSHLIADLPSAYFDVPWIEVEAKGKEEAVLGLM
ncbi:UV DNA damage repair endonuclease UvsE [Deinococcus detaillensis]|uniref:UV DNA damage repair endonuclease UvsE n=1 Tax=Deinococcus detaillensis TaxID=2592048 RepID=A0A553USI8_9DEIO|nr:UV DNA damage repair endonuclease UvsE [Deinococcus detaillensis]TSA83170.1 UV DNA damage repair endonuclease UvsE [Deinococcus detaillensis]